MRSLSFAIAALAQIALGISAARAQTTFESSTRIDDPFVLAQTVERIGDEAILAHLGNEASIEERLFAIRATPYLDVPELAIVSLASALSATDPDLAPAAAHALLRIVRGLALEPWSLESHEVLPDELLPARASLERLAEDTIARGDLRRVATLILDLFDRIGIRAPNEPADNEPEPATP